MKKLAVFSVGPIPGKRKVTTDHGLTYVAQNEVAFVGLARVVYGSEYRGALLDSPTWRKLLGETTRQIEATEDYHHVFLEGFRVSDVQPETGVTHIELSLGS